MPFTKPAEAPTLTLEQYASLCAELAVSGTGRPAVLKRYGLENEEARKRQDQQWALKMHKNETLTAKFKELLTTFRTHLERERRR